MTERSEGDAGTDWGMAGAREASAAMDTVSMKGKGGMNASETSGTPAEAVALAGWRAGKALREIAVELYGPAEVEACWHVDGAMRSKIRRLLSKARARTGAGTSAGREADTDPGVP